MDQQFNISLHHLRTDWRSIEKRLPAEGSSLGELLAGLTGYVAPALLDQEGWQPVIDAARQWPPSCAAIPFGFEIQLRKPQPRADFGITLTAEGLTADWIRNQAEKQDAPPFMVRLAHLLNTLRDEDSALKREIMRIMLEIDIASAVSSEDRNPGVFLYFGKSADGRPRDTDAVLSALNAAAGWADDPAELRLARDFGRAIPGDVNFISLGAFPGRGRGFRLTATGFSDGAEVESFLSRIGWQGRCDLLAEMIARMTERGAFSKLGVMLYARGGSFERKIGLYLRQDQATLPSQLEALAAEGCLAEKLAGLDPAAMQQVILWGKTGEFRLLRGINHVKLVLTETGFEDIKAYFGLVCA